MDKDRLNNGEEPVRNKKGQFLPENNANPEGRPKGAKNKFSMTMLEEAIKAEEKVAKDEDEVGIFRKYVQMAYVNPVVMISLMKKFVADKEKIEHSTDGPLELSIKRVDAEDND